MTDDLPIRDALTSEANSLDIDARTPPELDELLSRADEAIWAGADAETRPGARRALLLAVAVLLVVVGGVATTRFGDTGSLPDDYGARWGRCMSQAQHDVLGEE